MHTESLYRRGVWGLWHTVTTVAHLVNTGMIGEDRSSYGWFTLFGDHFQHDFLGNIYTIIYTVYNTSTNITLQPTQFLYVAACWKHAIRYPSLDLGRLIGFPFPLQGVRWCFRSAYGFVWNEDCWIEFAQCFSFLARGTPIRGRDQVLNILSHFCPCTGSWCWGRVGGGHCKASGIADCSKENPQ